jgi:hypothetical protein
MLEIALGAGLLVAVILVLGMVWSSRERRLKFRAPGTVKALEKTKAYKDVQNAVGKDELEHYKSDLSDVALPGFYQQIDAFNSMQRHGSERYGEELPIFTYQIKSAVGDSHRGKTGNYLHKGIGKPKRSLRALNPQNTATHRAFKRAFKGEFNHYRQQHLQGKNYATLVTSLEQMKIGDPQGYELTVKAIIDGAKSAHTIEHTTEKHFPKHKH